MAFLKIRQDYRQGILSDRFSFFMVFASVFFCAIGFLIIILKWKNLPPQLPVFYSMPWGEANLGPKQAILILPSFGLVVLLINLFFLKFLIKNNIFLGRIMTIFIFICSFLALYNLFKIVYLLA